ncbi:MAG: phosphotransferase family protein [Pseudomonadota bacterium]
MNVAGLPDQQVLQSWGRQEFGQRFRIHAIGKFSTGQSNPTFRLKTSLGEWVLRKKPAGNLLPSAHAIEREFEVMSALRDSVVPVPEMIALCRDESIIGTPFFLMSYVRGRTLTDPRLPGWTSADRKAMCFNQLNLAADLASIQPEKIGLDEFGRSGNYVERQIRRWSQQYKASETQTIPEMDQLIHWLSMNPPPEEAGTALVHGDFRLDNLIIHPDRPEIIAIIDWELSTLGHPLVDLTYWLTMLSFPDDGHFPGISASQRESEGIPQNEELFARFVKSTRTNIDVNMDYWIAFHCFRFAAIVQGVHKRSLDGNASAADAEQVGRMAMPVADLGWHHAERAMKQ